MNLLVVGSVAYDSIITPFAKADKILGGSASYFSLAAQYFNKAEVVAIVGSDFKAADKNILAKAANISGLEVINGKTFHWAGKYHFDLNTRDTLKTQLGVFANFKPTLSPALQNSQYVFLGNIHPKLQLDVLSQIKKPKFIGLDTMNYWIETAQADLKKVLKKVNVLIINDSEARELTKEHNIVKCAKKILSLMNSPLHLLPSTLVIKRGEYGLLMFNNKMQTFNLPGYPLEDVTDPTGAGDSFAGGFMSYLTGTNNTNWDNLKKACVAGSVMASFCCEKIGVKGLLKLSQEKIGIRLKNFKTLTHFEG